MKEKFTITSADKKYMNSIGKNLRTSPKRVNPYAAALKQKQESAQPKNPAIKIGKGRSGHSGKTYTL